MTCDFGCMISVSLLPAVADVRAPMHLPTAAAVRNDVLERSHGVPHPTWHAQTGMANKLPPPPNPKDGEQLVPRSLRTIMALRKQQAAGERP